MKLLVLCLLFGAVLALTGADPPETKPNNEVEDPSVDEKDIAEPESVEETEPTEEPEPVDETELSEAEDEESGERAKRCVRTCTPGRWCTFRGRRYKYYALNYQWSQAQKYCLIYGATLASVPNRAVDNFLKTLGQKRPAWIGMFDGANEGVWLWVNSQRVTYTNWCRKEPNNVAGVEHCAQINWTGDKCWNDHRCHFRFHFICEKK